MSDASQTTNGTFEIERDGETASLAYQADGEGWMSLLHTWVPTDLRGRGIANELAQMAFEAAKEKGLKVEVVCPVVFHFLTKHPEYKYLVGIRGYK